MDKEKKFLLKIQKLPGSFFKEGHAWFRLEVNSDAGKPKQPILKGDGCAVWVMKEEKTKKEEETFIEYEDIFS